MRQTRPAVSDKHRRPRRPRCLSSSSPRDAGAAKPRASVDPTTLVSGAYDDERGGRRGRFYRDTTPGYFGDGWPARRRGPRAAAVGRRRCVAPRHLPVGVQLRGSSPNGPGCGRPGLPDGRPRGRGVSRRGLVSSARGPTCSRTRARSSPVLLPLRGADRPADRPTPTHQRPHRGRPAVPASRTFLNVYQGSLHVAGLDGPRGRPPAPAYNYIVQPASPPCDVRRCGPWCGLPR